jgi:hypothetical protein
MQLEWIDMPRLIYPACRTEEDEKKGGYRHFGDAELRGTGCGIAFMPLGAQPDRPWRTYTSWCFAWPGDFPDRESAKAVVERMVISRSSAQ